MTLQMPKSYVKMKNPATGEKVYYPQAGQYIYWKEPKSTASEAERVGLMRSRRADRRAEKGADYLARVIHRHALLKAAEKALKDKEVSNG